MNIGITCYPTFGGSGIVATEIGLSLGRRGHRVHFIAAEVPSRLDEFVDTVFFHAVEVRDYPLFDHPYTLALASKMVAVATYEKLDLLHVHYAIPHAASAFLARQILGARAPRLVTTLHGTDITLVGNDSTFYPITRFSILHSDGVTVPSQYLAHATRNNFQIEAPIEVIPNFVDCEVYRPADGPRGERLRHLFEGGERAPILVHNSNFRPLKRVDDVVRVLAAVRRRVPARLLLIGDGPERSRVEALVRELGLGEAVRFLGMQRNFVDVLQSADLFLLPSQIESFGLAALEALACGVPVVASRTGGVPEVVADGEVGLLFEVGDVEAMAGGVVRLLEDAALWARMSAAARARALALYPREPTVSRYEAYYRRVLGE
jgi:N-acetyl-alpha-D-glucosaminyl L-malate synthase BshA